VALSLGSCVPSASLNTLIPPPALGMETVHGKGGNEGSRMPHHVLLASLTRERSLLPPPGVPPGVKIQFSPEMCCVWP